MKSNPPMIGIALTTINRGQMVYLAPDPQEESAFPDVSQMIEDLRPHLRQYQHAEERRICACMMSTFDEMKKAVSDFYRLPRHLLDDMHRIR